jgi:hypothetical protein
MGRRENVTNEDWFMMATLQIAGRRALLVLACCVAGMAAAAAADGNSAQHRAAEEMLAALAAGDAQAMALSIHPEELALLRQRLVDEMKLEAERNDSLLRSRLFGSGMPLTEIERLTPLNFFVTLAQRLRFGARTFDRVDWLAAVGARTGRPRSRWSCRRRLKICARDARAMGSSLSRYRSCPPGCRKCCALRKRISRRHAARNTTTGR